jgi:hypothetical protein
MKKIFLLATAAFLITGASFANNDGGGKGKPKHKKSCNHNCPGKECGKKTM